MTKKMIVGNWKLNNTLTDVTNWVDGVKIKLKNIHFTNNLNVIICPPYPYLLGMADLLENTKIKVGAQDVSQFEEGTYTGEVSAKMLSEIVSYVLIGHSERRKFFQEDLSIIKKKINKALVNNITPIVCVSDKVWGNGLPAPKYSEKFFLNQIRRTFRGLTKKEKNKVIFAYEPPSAISKQKHGKGHGQAANVEKVVEAIEKIKNIAPDNKVIYGGSANAKNITTYFAKPMIDGILPGSASIHAQDFGEMIKNAVKGFENGLY